MSGISCSFEPLSRLRERGRGEGGGGTQSNVEFCRVLSTLTPTLSRLREREPAKAAI